MTEQPNHYPPIPFKKYSSPLGNLLVKYEVVREVDGTRESQHRCSLIFVPPRWLGSAALGWEFRASHSASCRLPGLGISLSPMVYNRSPELRSAIVKFDVEMVMRLMRSGAARLSDYLPDKKPVTLLEVLYPHHPLDPTGFGTDISQAISSRVDRQPGECVVNMYRLLMEQDKPLNDPQSVPLHRPCGLVIGNSCLTSWKICHAPRQGAHQPDEIPAASLVITGDILASWRFSALENECF